MYNLWKKVYVIFVWDLGWYSTIRISKSNYCDQLLCSVVTLNWNRSMPYSNKQVLVCCPVWRAILVLLVVCQLFKIPGETECSRLPTLTPLAGEFSPPHTRTGIGLTSPDCLNRQPFIISGHINKLQPDMLILALMLT